MKPGPKPRPGPRENNGRLKRDLRKPEDKIGPTPQMLERRAEIVPYDKWRGAGSDGKKSADLYLAYLAKGEGPGKALHTLYDRNDISYREWQAGEKLRASWIRWRSLQGIPPRTQTTRGKASNYDPEWEQLDEARQEYEERLMVCVNAGGPTALIRATIESLCFEDMVPPRVYEIGTVPIMIRENIRKSLAALATHLGIQERT